MRPTSWTSIIGYKAHSDPVGLSLGYVCPFVASESGVALLPGLAAELLLLLPLVLSLMPSLVSASPEEVNWPSDLLLLLSLLLLALLDDGCPASSA
jgi:hypothetical protein